MDILGDQSSLGRLRGPTTRQKSSSFAAPERLCASTSCTPRFVDSIGGEFAVRASNFSDFGPPPGSAPQPPKPPSTPLSPSPSNKLQEVRRILQQEPLVAQRRQSCPAHPDTHLLSGRSSASARISTDFAPEVTAPGHPVYVVRRAYRSSLDGSQPSSANSTAPGDEALPGAWTHTNGAQSHSGWAATSSVGRAPSAGPSPLPSRRALHPRSGSCTPTVGASAPGSPLLPPPPPNAAGGLGQVPLAKVPGTASLPKPPPQEGVHLHSCSPGGESEASSPQHGGVGAGGGGGGSMGGSIGGAAMMATRPPRPSRFKSSNGLLVSSIAPPPALASSPLHSAASGPLFGGHGQGLTGHGRGSATCGGGFTTVSQSTSAAVSPPHTPRGRGSGNGDWPPPVTAGSGAQNSTAPSCHSHMGSPFGDTRHDGDPESLPSPFSELPTSSQIFSSLLRAGSAGASGRGPTRLFAHDPDGLPISNTTPRGPMAISDTGAATGGLMGQASGALRASKSGAGPVAVAAAAAAAAARPQPPGLGLVSGHLLCRVLMFLYYSAVLVAEVDAWRNHSIRQSASARLRRLEEEEEEEGFWHYGARSGSRRGAGSSGLLGSIQGWIRSALAVLDPGGTGPLAAAFPLAHAALAVPCLLALLGGVWWEPAALVLGGRLLWDLACRHGWGLLMFYKGESAQLMRMKELAVVGATLVAAARSIPAAGGSSIVNTSNGTNARSGSSSSGGTSRNGSTASLSAAAAAAASAAAAGDSGNTSDYDSGCGSGTDGGNMTPRLSSPLARGAGHSSSSSAAWPQQRRPSAGEAHARDLRRGAWRQDSPTPGAGGAAAAHPHSPPPALASSGHKLPPPPPSLPRSPSVRAPLPQLGSEAPLPEPKPPSDLGGEHAANYLDEEVEEEEEQPLRGRRGPSSRHHCQHPSRGARGVGAARGRLGGLAGALVLGRWALLQAGLGLMAPLFLYYGCVQVEHVRDMQDAGGVGGALRELVGDTYRWVPPGDGSLNTFWLPSQFAMALPYFTGMGPQWLAVALAGAVGMEGLLCWRFWARGGMLWTYAFYVGRHFLANAVIAGGVLLSLPAAQVQAPARSAALWRRKHKTT